MKTEQADVIVIGAGPSGAVASAMLSKMGYSVVIVERQQFPRFSIGESLLPQCMVFLQQAGMDDAVREQASHAGFQFKDGAVFHKNGEQTEFDFTKKFSAGPGTTFQVKRADFDKALADSAQQQGVDIRYQHSVLSVDVDGDTPSIEVQAPDKSTYHLSGKFLLDASGFGRVLPKLLELETPSDFPSRCSYFTHIRDNICDDSFDRNKILITVHPEYQDVWYWLIPFADGTSSIGVVAEAEFFEQYQSLTNEEVLKLLIQQAPNLSSLLSEYENCAAVNNIVGYAANVSSLVGNNYALLGNAGEFLDPVFSSGVTIATKSAAMIAPLVDKYLQGQSVDFTEDYEKQLRLGIDCFRTFVTAWYEGSFQDVIFYPKQEPEVREMISSILAGYAWDVENPYVAKSKRRFKVLSDLCRGN
ncbi:NAD(P)/FAD-dependent oxidoreductase [Thalassotalea litorea]|uniref:NAD(P)/FAD-dependent oxidoreductase n=1 Tax=Thalassotalea litorea TaxID=2020715 RepID=UPI003735FA62